MPEYRLNTKVDRFLYLRKLERPSVMRLNHISKLGNLLQSLIGLANFFGPDCNYFQALQSIWFLSQLFNLVIVAQKQPQAICKGMSMAVIQQNFIYKTVSFFDHWSTIMDSIPPQTSIKKQRCLWFLQEKITFL